MPCARSSRPAVPATPAASHREDTCLAPPPPTFASTCDQESYSGCSHFLEFDVFPCYKAPCPSHRGFGEGQLSTLMPSPAARVQRGDFSPCAWPGFGQTRRKGGAQEKETRVQAFASPMDVPEALGHPGAAVAADVESRTRFGLQSLRSSLQGRAGVGERGVLACRSLLCAPLPLTGQPALESATKTEQRPQCFHFECFFSY